MYSNRCLRTYTLTDPFSRPTPNNISFSLPKVYLKQSYQTLLPRINCPRPTHDHRSIPNFSSSLDQGLRQEILTKLDYHESKPQLRITCCVHPPVSWTTLTLTTGARSRRSAVVDAIALASLSSRVRMASSANIPPSSSRSDTLFDSVQGRDINGDWTFENPCWTYFNSAMESYRLLRETLN